MKLPECSHCQKTVWPWSKKSKMATSPTHHKCHEDDLNKHILNNPEDFFMYWKELREFESVTGIKTGIKLISPPEV